MEAFLLLVALVIPLWLNIKATLAIKKDTLSDDAQKTAQLLLVWLLPLIGSVIVLAVNRPKEKHSGRYPKDQAVLDEDLSGGSAMRKLSDAIDSD